jgi:hypothetical protein
VARDEPSLDRRERALAAGEQVVRIVAVPGSLVGLVVAFGFFGQVSWATRLWPWPASALSYMFIASILTAIAIPMLWIGVSGETAAMEAGALDLAVMFGGMVVYLLTLLGDPGQPRLWPYVVVFGVACATSSAAVVVARGTAWRDPRPMPLLVRASFGLFAAILLAAGTAMVLDTEIFPWPLGPQNAVMFGLMYLGAAAYFIHAVFVPRWSNAVGQLAGFLVYDLILLAPFAGHFDAVHGRQLLSLIIYVTVLVYSAGLASYYLFVAPATRMSRPAA